MRQTHSAEITIENILEDRLFIANNVENTLNNNEARGNAFGSGDSENDDEDYEDITSSEDDHTGTNWTNANLANPNNNQQNNTFS